MLRKPQLAAGHRQHDPVVSAMRRCSAVDAGYLLLFGEWGQPGRTYQLPPPAVGPGPPMSASL
jgi:hypothetical protein